MWRRAGTSASAASSAHSSLLAAMTVRVDRRSAENENLRAHRESDARDQRDAGGAAVLSLLGVSMMVVFVVVACSADMRPKASSPPGRIAYSTRGGDIWVMNADGTGR